MPDFDYYDDQQSLTSYHDLVGDPHEDVSYSAVRKKGGRSVFDWWEENGSTAVDAASDLICLADPTAPRCRPQYQQAPPPPSNNGLLYVLLGVVVVLLLVFILKN